MSLGSPPLLCWTENWGYKQGTQWTLRSKWEKAWIISMCVISTLKSALDTSHDMCIPAARCVCRVAHPPEIQAGNTFFPVSECNKITQLSLTLPTPRPWQGEAQRAVHMLQASRWIGSRSESCCRAVFLSSGRGAKSLVWGQPLTVARLLCSDRMTASLLPGTAAPEGRHKHGRKEYFGISPHAAVSGVPCLEPAQGREELSGLLHAAAAYRTRLFGGYSSKN